MLEPPPALLFSPHQLQQGVKEWSVRFTLTLHSSLPLHSSLRCHDYLLEHPPYPTLLYVVQCTACCPEPPMNASHTTMDMDKTTVKVRGVSHHQVSLRMLKLASLQILYNHVQPSCFHPSACCAPPPRHGANHPNYFKHECCLPTLPTSLHMMLP